MSINRDRNKNIEKMIRHSMIRFGDGDKEVMDYANQVILDILKNKGDGIETIKKSSLIKVSDIPDGYTSIDDAVNIVTLIQSVISEYLAENIEWWIEIALEQYRRIATQEVKRITDTILSAYSKSKNVTVEDVRDATYKSFFKNTPRVKVEVLIPKDSETTKDLLDMIEEYRGRKNKNVQGELNG